MTLVAIQGIRGSYSEEAAERLTGGDRTIVECLNFLNVFEALESSAADLAVIPVENKITGPIEATNELLRSSGSRILREINLQIQHVLAGTKYARLAAVKNVRSHPEALKQCRRFFEANDQLHAESWSDTASSIRSVITENEVENAAICSRRAADVYGAEVLLEQVADENDNWTKFYLITKI